MFLRRWLNWNTFYQVPADYNETDYKRELIKFCLWEKSTLNDTASISINYIRDRCRYSESNRNKNSFSAYVRFVLKDLIARGEIVQIYGEDIDTALGISYLEFKILDKFYNMPSNIFAKLTVPVFNSILDIKCSVSKPILLKVYTYMRCHMIENPPQPYGFRYGLDKTIVRDLHLNRKTVDTCLDAFVDKNIFIKYTTGSYCKDGEPRNAPNIYVIPDDNAENNIKALLEELKQRYGVDKFVPIITPVT